MHIWWFFFLFFEKQLDALVFAVWYYVGDHTLDVNCLETRTPAYDVIEEVFYVFKWSGEVKIRKAKLQTVVMVES